MITLRQFNKLFLSTNSTQTYKNVPQQAVKTCQTIKEISKHAKLRMLSSGTNGVLKATSCNEMEPKLILIGIQPRLALKCVSFYEALENGQPILWLTYTHCLLDSSIWLETSERFGHYTSLIWIIWWFLWTQGIKKWWRKTFHVPHMSVSCKENDPYHCVHIFVGGIAIEYWIRHNEPWEGILQCWYLIFFCLQLFVSIICNYALTVYMGWGPNTKLFHT